MVKIIIELRDFDTYGKKIDNREAIRDIYGHANEYFNCESVGQSDSKQ